MQVARSGRPGPVHLSIPSDLFEAPVEGADSAIPAAEAFRAVPAPLADRTAEAVIADLARAKRPLVLTGPTMVENYANTGQLKAAQAKYGLPNPAEFTK